VNGLHILKRESLRDKVQYYKIKESSNAAWTEYQELTVLRNVWNLDRLEEVLTSCRNNRARSQRVACVTRQAAA